MSFLSDLLKSGVARFKRDANGNVVGQIGPDGRVYQGIKTSVAAAQKVFDDDPAGGAGGAGGTGAGTGSGLILDTQRTAFGPFIGVRLVFANFDTTAPMQINKAAVAVTPNVGQALGQGNFSATSCYGNGPDGNTLTWVPVTFNDGAVAATVPAGVAGSVVTTNNVHIQPGILLSDFVAISSVARADGKALPFLRTRTHINDNSFPPKLITNHVQGFNSVPNAAINGGHIFLSGVAADVAANLTTKSLVPYYSGGFVEPVGVIFYGAQGVRNIGCFGDSLTRGAKSLGQVLGWPDRMNAKYGSPVSGLAINTMNWGVSGQRLENSLAICRNFCAKYKPHYASIFAWSPNNAIGSSQANMDALWANVLYTIDYLQQLGVTPVVLTSGPVNGQGPVDVSLWRAQNARVMSLPASVIKVDVGTALTAAGTYNTTTPVIAAAYDAGDTTHYTDAGYALMADMVYAAIS